MRKLMVAVATVTGLALAAGCSKRDEALDERRDLAQAQQEAQKDMADIRQDAAKEQAEIQRDEQKDLAEVQKDVSEERQDVAEADRELAVESGSLAASSTVQGTVQSTLGNSLVLIVPGNKNAELKLKTDDKTRVTENNRAVELDDFDEGTEVRASYVKDGDDMVARDVVIISPVMDK
ncbi:hypothetical protein POL68_02535 [Stigmatella sp. ncwal1]|uniref:DUF5666 domain-containing protein n=1 Tax=Stigmatella ashevillensis TaxID=2995309 RepID=A0ABT5D0Z5_9BACT|nr:hypothetical protein [Stigmatella ashevillena]MDC0707337.1 hypothetical protein [Stigmatella ashevillena]